MVPAKELTQIRADAAAAVCDLDCKVYEKTVVNDPWGSSTPTYQLNAETKAGTSQPNASLLQNYADRLASLSTWLVHLPYGTEVQQDWRLTVDGQDLDVQVVLKPRSLASLVSVLATELVSGEVA